MGENINKGRIAELDALRGIAAVLVVIFHLIIDLNIPSWFKVGTTGVDLFFMISGFVIFMTIQKVGSAKEFLMKRAVRLYPSYWFSATFTFALIIITSLLNNKNIEVSAFYRYFANLTMFQYYFNEKDLDAPYWTLIIEALFYILMAVLLKFKFEKHINLIILPLIIITVNLNQGLVENIIKIFPLISFLPLFLAGINFYKIYEGNNGRREIVIISICLFCQLLLFRSAGYSHLYIKFEEYALMLLLYFIGFIAFTRNRLSFIVNPTTLFLGQISYPLYLIHKFVSVKFLIPILLLKFHINYWIASFVIALPIVIILASAVTYYVDIPARQYLYKRFYK